MPRSVVVSPQPVATLRGAAAGRLRRRLALVGLLVGCGALAPWVPAAPAGASLLDTTAVSLPTVGVTTSPSTTAAAGATATTTAVTLPAVGVSVSPTAVSVPATGVTLPGTSVTLPGTSVTVPGIGVTLPSSAVTLPSVGVQGPVAPATVSGGAPAGSGGTTPGLAPAAGPAPACPGCAPTGAGRRPAAGGAAPPRTAEPAAALAGRSLGYAAHAGFPLLLVLAGIAFLLVQDRIDRRDPRLAPAPDGERWLAVGDPIAGDAATGEGFRLEERLGAMQLARVVLGAVALVLALAVRSPGPDPGFGGAAHLALATAAYLLLAVTAGRLWRVGPRRSLLALGALFLLDGAFLSFLVVATGGVGSPLQYLLPSYVVAVTLLVSYRTGVKVTVWNALLLLAAYYAERASIVPATAGPGAFRSLLVAVTALYATDRKSVV